MPGIRKLNMNWKSFKPLVYFKRFSSNWDHHHLHSTILGVGTLKTFTKLFSPSLFCFLKCSRWFSLHECWPFAHITLLLLYLCHSSQVAGAQTKLNKNSKMFLGFTHVPIPFSSPSYITRDFLFWDHSNFHYTILGVLTWCWIDIAPFWSTI